MTNTEDGSVGTSWKSSPRERPSSACAWTTALSSMTQVTMELNPYVWERARAFCECP